MTRNPHQTTFDARIEIDLSPVIERAAEDAAKALEDHAAVRDPQLQQYVAMFYDNTAKSIIEEEIRKQASRAVREVINTSAMKALITKTIKQQLAERTAEANE